MFDAATRNKIEGGYLAAFNLMAVPAVWRQAKAPHATRNLDVGYSVATLREQEIVNAYGIGTKIITVKVSDLPNLEKFDRFEINGTVETLDAVLPLHVNGTHLFWQGYVKGK